MSKLQVEHQYSQIWENLYQKSVVDRSITRFQTVTIPDSEGSSGLNQKQVLRFRARPGNNFMLPSFAYLDIVYKIVKRNGDDYDPGDIITTVGNFIYAFSEVRMLVNGRALETHLNPGISSMINYLNELPSTMLKSTGDAEGFIPDTGAGGFSLSPVTTTVADDGGGGYTVTTVKNRDYNAGFDERFSKSKGSQYVQVKIPLARMFNFLKHTLIPASGVDLEFEFKLARGFNQVLIKNPGADLGRLHFEKFELQMPYVNPSPEVEAVLLDSFMKGASTTVLYDHQILRTSPQYLAGTTSVRWEITSITTIPTGINVVILPSSVLNHNNEATIQQGNPTLFRHLDVRRMSITIGNQQIPEEAYELNFDPVNGPIDYVRLYNDYITSTHCCANKSSVESVVSFEDFRRLYTVFHIDLSNNIDNSRFDWTTSHSVRLDLTLGTPAPYDFDIHCLLGKERIVKTSFTQDRKILLDFNNE